LNLLWTVPLALAIGYVPVFYVQLRRCGINACLGDPGGWASPYAVWGLIAAAIAGALLFIAILTVPWRRPWQHRILVAIVPGVLLAVFWIKNILF